MARESTGRPPERKRRSPTWAAAVSGRGSVPCPLFGTFAPLEKGGGTAPVRSSPKGRRRPPAKGAAAGDDWLGARAYFLGIIDPVWRYRVWKEKASSNMCGEWRPALGFFMARFT